MPPSDARPRAATGTAATTGPASAADGNGGWHAWERDDVLREQAALLRQNFPMTLLASLATALGTLWVMARVAEPRAIVWWLALHTLVVCGVYLTLRGIAPFTDPARQAARKLIACMAPWGSAGAAWATWCCTGAIPTV